MLLTYVGPRSTSLLYRTARVSGVLLAACAILHTRKAETDLQLGRLLVDVPGTPGPLHHRHITLLVQRLPAGSLAFAPEA
jgi:hypothetical protein